jgi:hypothetical protein
MFFEILSGKAADQHLRTHTLASAVLFLRLVRKEAASPGDVFERALLFDLNRRHHGALAGVVNDLLLNAREIEVLERQFQALDLAGMAPDCLARLPWQLVLI